MKKLLLICSFCFINTVYSSEADSILVIDPFTDLNQIFDLSKLVLWGENTDTTSCFTTSLINDFGTTGYNAIHVSDAATPYSTYVPEVNGHQTLRTTSCFDYSFGKIDRIDKNITIEFDLLFSQYDSGYGEQGRMVITLVDDYPDGGLRPGDIDSLQLTAPFGRPKYNLRLRNSMPVSESNNEYIHRSPSFMLYGGGLDAEGEFEKSADWGYWMPGFSSEAGGGAPGQPSASDFPATGTKKSDKPWQWNSTDYWHHYTWQIEPELMSLYMRRSSDNESENTLVARMSIPQDDLGEDYIIEKMNEVHGTTINTLPPLYKWHPSFSAVRIYFRGFNGNIAYLANLKIAFENIEEPVLVENQPQKPENPFYPNPAINGTVYSRMEINQLTIYDIGGRLVGTLTHLPANRITDISHLRSGIYIYKAQLTDLTSTQGKIIIP